eukprot:m.210274 g.210274  ORF g.210274 m.210274 type:complete len:84 (-) comp15050_c0_seq5:491-742(-)
MHVIECMQRKPISIDDEPPVLLIPSSKVKGIVHNAHTDTYESWQSLDGLSTAGRALLRVLAREGSVRHSSCHFLTLNPMEFHF